MFRPASLYFSQLPIAVFSALIFLGLSTVATAQSKSARDRYIEKYQIEVRYDRPEGKKEKHIQASARYAYAPDVMYAVCQNYTYFRYFVPKMTKSEVIWQQGNLAHVRFELDPPFPFSKIHGVIRIQAYPQTHRFEWRLLEGNLKAFEGEAHIAKVDEQTSSLHLMTYVNLGFLMPSSLLYWATKKYLPETLAKLNSRFYFERYKRQRGMRPTRVRPNPFQSNQNINPRRSIQPNQ